MHTCNQPALVNHLECCQSLAKYFDESSSFPDKKNFRINLAHAIILPDKSISLYALSIVFLGENKIKIENCGADNIKKVSSTVRNLKRITQMIIWTLFHQCADTSTLITKTMTLEFAHFSKIRVFFFGFTLL